MIPFLKDPARWSVRPGGGGVVSSSGERVVITPPSIPLETGFAVALREFSQGADRVRLVGRAITRRASWPAWVIGGQYDLVLTEIDAYLPPDKALQTRDLWPDFEHWLATVFAGAFAIERPERVFWSSAMHRIFRPTFEAWPLALGIAECHGRNTIVCVDNKWAGLEALRTLADQAGGRVYPRRAALKWQYEVTLFSHWLVSLAGFYVYRLHEFWRERHGRRELARLRRQYVGSPRIWIGLLADWPRACRHVVESVAAAARQGDHQVGVILQSALLPGLRREDDTHAHTGFEVFPTLGHPLLAGRICAIEQCASAQSFWELIRVMAAATCTSVRALWRVYQFGEQLDRGSLLVDFVPRTGALTRLITIDVLRSTESFGAGCRLAVVRDVLNNRIVWPHASLAHVTAPDLALQSAGAITYDLVHGALAEPMDMITFERTHSSIKVVWTCAEEKYLEPYTTHQQCQGGVMPRPLPADRAARAIKGPVRILAVTNYVNGATKINGILPLECFQEAFFECLSEALGTTNRGFTLKWRPHPSDDRTAVAATAARYADLSLELSLAPDELASDLEWADIVVTSLSSSIVEALCHPVPIFVHELPLHEANGLLATIEVGRRFGRGRELAPRLVECMTALAAGDTEVLSPESALRDSFFGSSGAPRGIGELLWPEYSV